MTSLPSLRDSLRFRLLAGTLVWIIASIALAGWGLAGLFRQHVEDQLQRDLQARLDQLTASLADTGATPTLSAVPGDPRLSRPYGGLYWQIDRLGVGGAGLGLLRSRSLWDANLPMPADTPANGDVHRHRVIGPRGSPVIALERVVIPEGNPEHPLRLTMAAEESDLEEPIARFGRELWMALAILGLGLVTAAVVQVLVGLAPLRRLQRTLAAIRQGHTQQLDGHFPQELRPLVEDFNAVLAQNTAMTARARTQAGNLAHALKTPLTVLANAAAAREPGLAETVREQVELARRQVDWHLARARAAAAVHVPGLRTELRPTAEALLRVMARLHAERGLAMAFPPCPDGLAFHGEGQDLQEMLGNLLDNACKWAASRVELQADRFEGQLRIRVDDDGQGIPADQRDAVLRRGIRADETTPGSGLGLAIVTDLAALYGGRISLGESPLGGLRATLLLPAA
jgi:signal transduction histidine kinase